MSSYEPTPEDIKAIHYLAGYAAKYAQEESSLREQLSIVLKYLEYIKYVKG